MRGSTKALIAGRWLVLGGLMLGACGPSDDEAPGPLKRAPQTRTEGEVALVVPPSCSDLAATRGWQEGACEAGGNGVCGGQGEATYDCERCCEAPPPPTCGEIAKQRGWAGYACEPVDDAACGGLGELSSDCDVCCEAPLARPTCAQVAAEWGYDQAVCERDDNDACGGDGIPTSDCDVCCDAPAVEAAELADDPGGLPAQGLDESEDDPMDDELAGESDDPAEQEPYDPNEIPPPPPPAPTTSCGVLATQSGWPSPACEYKVNGTSNNACQGQGPATTDCDHCCSGTAGPPASSAACGNGTCGDGETCSSCAKDCGACVRVAELNVDGLGAPELHRTIKALKAQKPAVVALQGSTKSVAQALAQGLGLGHRAFAVGGEVKGKKSDEIRKMPGNSVLSRYPFRSIQAQRLPSKKWGLVKAVVAAPDGDFAFGSTQMEGGSKLAAAAAGFVNDKTGLLAAALGAAPPSAAYTTLGEKMSDAWLAAWGGGETSDRREDFLFRGGAWAPVAGKVIGEHGGKMHGALVEKFNPAKLRDACAKAPECKDCKPEPPVQAFFNFPKGGPDERLEELLIGMINRTPDGESIRVSLFTFTRVNVARALVEAHQCRKVDVRVVLDAHNVSPTNNAYLTLKAGLPADNLTVCHAADGHGSCLGTGINHSKIFLFSAQSDGSKNVVVQSSANLSGHQLALHNNLIVVRGDKDLYDGYVSYWNDQRADEQRLDYYRVVDGGKTPVRAYFFPRPPQAGTSADTVVDVLKNVSCNDNHKNIWVTMAIFTDSRASVAQALVDKAQHGCNVQVLLNHPKNQGKEDKGAKNPGKKIQDTLEQGLGKNHVHYVKKNGVRSGLHSKYLVFDALYNGSGGPSPRKLVFTGSHNYTKGALRTNDEQLIRVDDPKVFEAFTSNWSAIRKTLKD